MVDSCSDNKEGFNFKWGFSEFKRKEGASVRIHEKMGGKIILIWL